MPSDALCGSVRGQVGFWGCVCGVGCVGVSMGLVSLLVMFCFLLRCCMICVLVAVGCVGLLVLGGLLSTGRRHGLVVCRSNRSLLFLSRSLLLCDMCCRSGSCPYGVVVVFRVGFGRCRSVMGCGAVPHRLGRCVVVSFFFGVVGVVFIVYQCGVPIHQVWVPVGIHVLPPCSALFFCHVSPQAKACAYFWCATYCH